ncbi:LexA-binding, inner membrane-associated putative hydrolase [Halogeometricum rufum]|uniref:LexA-binding, inner membrane-associated putative hydrolase n=1 Tax=Halogeometricum rufum TaxID=553469 RepID=A0A1I6J4L0_9EURY|nr:metal-dependent hydrolase [Halogeometricum rufum]SFR73811.1 LexA-binding, inner membrane-associated putative hydrolase [Halogeometricum rufum]
MWPYAHLAVGYLLYSGYAHVRLRRPPSELAALFVVLGTQLPDFVDKPLALVGVLASGRSLAHSFLFAVPVVALVAGLVYRRTGDTAPGVAFGVSYVSATIGDGAQQFVQGGLANDLREVSFWVWPLSVPAERIVELLGVTPGVERLIAGKAAWTAAHLPLGPELKVWIRWFEFAVTVLALSVWFLDGAPGLKLLRETVIAPRRKRGEENG